MLADPLMETGDDFASMGLSSKMVALLFLFVQCYFLITWVSILPWSYLWATYISHYYNDIQPCRGHPHVDRYWLKFSSLAIAFPLHPCMCLSGCGRKIVKPKRDLLKLETTSLRNCIGCLTLLPMIIWLISTTNNQILKVQHASSMDK